MKAPFPLAGEAAALASSVLWAGAGIVFRRLKGRASPMAMNFAKNTTATACFLVVCLLWKGVPWPFDMPLEAQAALAASGLLGLSVCDTFYLRAMLEIGPRRASVLMALAPVLVFVAVLFPPFSQVREVDSPWPWLGLAAAVGGIVLAAREARGGEGDPRRHGTGVRDALAGAAFQAAGVWLARWGIEHGAEPVQGAYVRLAAGAGGLAVLGLLTGRAAEWQRTLSRRSTLWALVVAAFFGTFLGIGLNQVGLAWSDSTGAVTTINSLSPVWLIPLSTWFLGERHGLRAWGSTLLALAGVAMLSA